MDEFNTPADNKPAETEVDDQDAMQVLEVWRRLVPSEAYPATAARVARVVELSAAALIPTDRTPRVKELVDLLGLRDGRAARRLADVLGRKLWKAPGWNGGRGDFGLLRTEVSESRVHDVVGSALWLSVAWGESFGAVGLAGHLGHQGVADIGPGVLAAVARLLPRYGTFSETVDHWYLKEDLREYALDSLGLVPVEDVLAKEKPEQTVRTVGHKFRGKASVVSQSRIDKAGYSALSGPLPVNAWPPAATVKAALLREFPWATEAVGAICSHLRLAERVRGMCYRLPPLVLEGRPGTGKTRLMHRLAELVEVCGGPGYGAISGAGMSDNRTLAGTAKGWSSASPGFAALTILRTAVANPVICYDELDKMSDGGHNGNAAQTLMALTDPSSNGKWLDEGLGVPLNLSQVSWIFTCNERSKIDPILRARLRFVPVPAPRPEDCETLLDYIIIDIAKEFGGLPSDLPDLELEIEEALCAAFKAGRLSARGMSRLVRRALDCALAVEGVQTLH
jgi:hypothetical protein